MAYIVSSTQLFGNAAAAATAVTLPAHQAGDYFVIWAGLPSGTATAGGSMTWAAPTGTTQNITGTGITSSIIYAKAATSSETLTITTAAGYAIYLIQVRDADQTTPFDVNGNHATNGATLSNTLTSAGLTTANPNSLILYFIASEGNATQTHSNPGVMSLASHDSTGTNQQAGCASAAWTIQQNAGATPTPGWSASASQTFTRATIAFRNAAGGRVPAYVAPSVSPGTRITSAFHVGTVDPTITFPNLSAIGTIAGKGGTTSTAVLGLDFGINPYASAISKTSATTLATVLDGYEINFVTARNVGRDLVVGSLISNNPKTAAFSLGTITQGGSVVVLGSNTTFWNAYQVAASDSKPVTDGRYVFAIQPGFSGSAYATGTGGSASNASLDFFQFRENYPNGTAGVTYLSELHQANTHVIAGGTSAFPVNNDGLVEIGKSFRIPLIQKTGPTSILSFVPIQVGGANTVNFQVDFGTLQFPRRANTSLKEISFHANNNIVGIDYYGRSGDVIKHTNSVITSPNKYFWGFDPLTGNTSVVTYDFTGLSVIGAGDVTLSSVVPLTEVSFVQCDQINVTSANTLTRCVFSQTTAPSSDGAVFLSGSTQAALQTNIDKFVDCTFTNNTSSNAAVKILYTGTGNVTLNMSTGSFSGNSKDIAWWAPAGSNLTINTTGTANPTTTTANNINSVFIVSTKTFTIQNIVANTEIRIYKQSDMSELAAAEDVGNTTPGAVNLSIANDTENTGRFTATYSYNYATFGVDTPIYIVAHSLTQQWLRSSATLKSDSGTLKIAQIPDRQYQNP